MLWSQIWVWFCIRQGFDHVCRSLHQPDGLGFQIPGSGYGHIRKALGSTLVLIKFGSTFVLIKFGIDQVRVKVADWQCWVLIWFWADGFCLSNVNN